MSSLHSLIKYEMESASDDDQSGSYFDRHNNIDNSSLHNTRNRTNQRTAKTEYYQENASTSVSRLHETRKRKYSSESEDERYTRSSRHNHLVRRSLEIGNKTSRRLSEKEMRRIQALIAKVERKLKDPQRRVRVAISDCKVSDYHRTLNEDHMDKILQAHQDGAIKLQQEVLIIMPNDDPNVPEKKYVIIDGQHRWKALKRAKREKHSNREPSVDPLTGEYRDPNVEYMNAIMLDKGTTLEEQRIAANLADHAVGTGLPFTDVDLIDEAVKITKFNPCFSSLRPTRRSTAKLLSFARMYNSRLQEFHLMVAGIDDLDQREPFCDLMQAVAEGKFKKPNGGTIYINSTRIWRQIMKAYNPDFEHNIQIVRETTGGNFDAFIERLETEGSAIRVWLDKNGRKSVSVRDFCKRVGLVDQPPDVVQKFLSSMSSGVIDECIEQIAKTRFTKSTKKSFYTVSAFVSKPIADGYEFVYVDMRYFKSMHAQIVNWIRNAGVKHIYLRDQNPDYTTMNTPCGLTSVYQKRHLATTTLLDIQFACGHPLRTSYLHVLSAGGKSVPLDHPTYDIMMFKELFGEYFSCKSGVCFVGLSDVSTPREHVDKQNYIFVFEDECDQNASGQISDGSPKTRESSEP